MGCGGNRPGAGGVQRVVRTVGVGLACALVAGCGGGVVGTPVAELWDPCSLPAEVLLSVEVEPEPRNATTQQQGDYQWKFCTFELEQSLLTVFSTTTPFDDVAADVRATERQPIFVAGEPAVQFLVPEISPIPSCFVSTGRSFGTVQFRVTERSVGTFPISEICASARLLADALADNAN